jgi:hypothetical protein
LRQAVAGQGLSAGRWNPHSDTRSEGRCVAPPPDQRPFYIFNWRVRKSKRDLNHYKVEISAVPANLQRSDQAHRPPSNIPAPAHETQTDQRICETPCRTPKNYYTDFVLSRQQILNRYVNCGLHYRCCDQGRECDTGTSRQGLESKIHRSVL